MPESKQQGESFFRKVVRFVANPATDWTALASRQEDTRELELEKSELKAMIERKRRNDFVRKREFDMLRKVRRDGLSPDQLAALGSSSKLDDSESRPDSRMVRPDVGVKAKIDEIEQQMVGDQSFGSTGSRRFASSTRSAALAARAAAASPPPRRPPVVSDDQLAGRVVDDAEPLPALPPLPDLDLDAPGPHAAPANAAPAAVQMTGGLPPLAPLSPSPASRPVDLGMLGNAFGGTAGVEVSEVAHDPDLDEPVISFANAEFAVAETSLQSLIGPGGKRSQHAETWLVLFDLYRATGQQIRFEALALDYAQHFGWSAPQWYSLPQLVADAMADERPNASARIGGEVSWICPQHLDTESVSRLRAQTLQTPLPWVFDWGGLRTMDAEAAMQMSTLFRVWAVQALEMRWMAGERLFASLREAAPTGVRDADPVFWLARLDALRLANRADQFDEAAIDYCVTYEVSPPSWEPARCNVHVSESNASSRIPSQAPSETSTSFLDSHVHDDGGGEVASVELSGQLVGDIGATLAKISGQLGEAPLVQVSCARLIRVDFIAAGDLLNWVIATAQRGRTVQFVDAHRLVALFYGAMGITEHAKVQVRKV